MDRSIKKLGETKTQFIDGDRSEKYPSRSEYCEYGVLFLNAESINTGRIDIHEADHITQSKYDSISKGRIRYNDILLTTRGNGIGDCAYVGIHEKGLINAQMLILRNENDSELHQRYLYYYFHLPSVKESIGVFSSGSAQPQIPIRDLKHLPVLLPKKTAQRKIAAILSAYDDLIEVNERRIALLEKMAEELYREWYVRMRFPGNVTGEHGYPEDWRMASLPDIASITYGFPFDGARFNNDGRGKPIIRIRNIPDSWTDDYSDEAADPKYIVHSGDLLIGMDGEFHINHWVGPDAYLVQRSCRLKPEKEILRAYLALAIKAPIKYFEATIQGATVGHLGAKHLHTIEILVPGESAKEGLDFLNKLLDQQIALRKTNQAFASTRDRLLGRLMSGALDVEELDIAFPPSMEEELASGA
jgi:type I restriction enzyme S subunit